MVQQKGKSGLAAKYGSKLNEAIKAHATDTTDYGMMRLPPGITSGIAQVIEAKFDTYKTGNMKGEYYFRMVGRVIEPETVDWKGQTINVKGQNTSIMIPVCDTKNRDGKVTPQDEHIKDILNEMRKVTDENYTADATVNELEGLAAGIVDLAPYFKFSTSERKARNENETDGVWENWNGNKGLENYTPPGEGDDAIRDKTGGKTDEMHAAGNPDEDKSVEELVEIAMGDGPDSESAAERLVEMALAAGVDQADIDAAETWKDTGDLILNATSAEGGGDDGSGDDKESEPEAPRVPKKGEAVKYQVLDANGKPMKDKLKKVMKPVDAEVTAVNTKKGTCDLKNLSNPKVLYKDVAFDAVIYED